MNSDDQRHENERYAYAERNLMGVKVSLQLHFPYFAAADFDLPGGQPVIMQARAVGVCRPLN
ncbi:hypothetical protein ABE142_24560 [Paenibacillus alvei]|uniref:hypothetical protein n=1 Tax=Paenibacillus alvei TaxID=44250 RepID=UPI0018CE8C02|nr:hypothetical protein [Paenibacillus alvei]MBG9733278.1 hypothetical protein [Paenibacillus alvei]MBG9745163.1 hypothetical protein [Paenibacillus alvei]MCY9580700.1 hypothetical protein [Paenibacillus alvei]MCY9585183.1 hypothetical protein [Paenibacillus alvei]